eukprot:1159900-Pelagomonas_calceolata.AAC.3
MKILGLERGPYSELCKELQGAETTLNTILLGSSGRGVTGCEAVQSSRRRTYARRRMADSNPPD